ncbi:hypothetical protein EHS25_004022 [Saitozyma podzolica]|uniref:Uncharacterized protein n=1 Tax=Saitozyma podzolica TaxID=1890683 RepID=A0A427YT16_9TREE|nr:hypothetical protein EHS25_004022 [Saitozyma podzolica]
MSTLSSSENHHGRRTTKLKLSVSLELARSIIALEELALETNSNEVPATVSRVPFGGAPPHLMAAPQLPMGRTIATLPHCVNVLKVGPSRHRFEAMFREADDLDELRLNMRHPETRKRLVEAIRGSNIDPDSFNQGAG